MISQEDLYHLILRGAWTDVLNILYSQRKEIASETMLQQASATFETEFFSRVKSYPESNGSILENLDTLYILNHGGFYRLSDSNYKTLILELIRRKPLNEAVNFARKLPEVEECKAVISKFEEANRKEQAPIKILPMSMIEIYNRLFELMNTPEDTATYFSGPKFINTLREFLPYFPTYSQYLEERARLGKSTSRKIFYYDILVGLEDGTRVKVLKRMLEMLAPFQPEKVQAIVDLLENKKVAETTTTKTASSVPIALISYSWDGEEHKQWVLDLAERLRKEGIDVILDRYYLRAGKSLPHFIENSIRRADKVIIIFTPNYKAKADNRAGGVGYEYSILNNELYNNQTENEKIIPVLRAGIPAESIPEFMQQYIHIDMTKDENFENSITDLVREIRNEPEIKIPELGEKANLKPTIIEVTVDVPSDGEPPSQSE